MKKFVHPICLFTTAMAATVIFSGCSGGKSEDSSNEAKRKTGFHEKRSRSSIAYSESFDQPKHSASIQPLVHDLRASLQQTDDDRLASASQQIAALLRNEPELLTEFVGEIQSEQSSEAKRVLTQVLASDTEIAQKPQSIQAAMEILRTDGATEVRQTALEILRQASNPTDEVRHFIGGIALDETRPDMQMGALAVLAQWINRGVGPTEEIRTWLFQAINASNNPEIRGYGLQTLALQGKPHSLQELTALAEFALKDLSPHHRAMAVRALGSAQGDTRAFALSQLQDAYSSETDPGIRRDILSQIVRTGQLEALGILQSLPASDPLLEQDIADYLEILQKPDVTSENVYSYKFKRDIERQAAVTPNNRHQ